MGKYKIIGELGVELMTKLEEFIMNPGKFIPTKKDVVDYLSSERFLGTNAWVWKEGRKIDNFDLLNQAMEELEEGDREGKSNGY